MATWEGPRSVGWLISLVCFSDFDQTFACAVSFLFAPQLVSLPRRYFVQQTEKIYSICMLSFLLLSCSQAASFELGCMQDLHM